MVAFAILRFAKHQGHPAKMIEDHHERKKEEYASNPDIDTSRSKDNFHIIKPEGSYFTEIQRRIDAAGCRTRKDSVRFIDTLITASPEFFEGKTKAEIQAYFTHACSFMEERIGKGNIVSAVVHMDEKTPHMHMVFVPLTEDKRLCAKELIGNRKKLIQWQDDYWKHMVEKYPDLERGESASETGRDHIPTRVYKEAVHLTKQANKINELLGGMTVFNFKKNGEQIAAKLRRFFPRMEKLQTQIKKYETSIAGLKEENGQLKAKAATASSENHDLRMQNAKLQVEVDRMQRVMAKIPTEVVAAYSRSPRSQQIHRGQGGIYDGR